MPRLPVLRRDERLLVARRVVRFDAQADRRAAVVGRSSEKFAHERAPNAPPTPLGFDHGYAQMWMPGSPEVVTIFKPPTANVVDGAKWLETSPDRDQ